MIGQFEPLIRCDRDGCDALVEPSVGRCSHCVKLHGPSPNAATSDGHAAPKQNPRRSQPFHVWQEQARAERKRRARKPSRVPSGLDLPTLSANNPAQLKAKRRAVHLSPTERIEHE